MEHKSEIVSVRCPGDRPHGEFDHCGRLLFSFDEEYIYIYCSHCKSHYKVAIHENMNVEMELLPKNERLELVNKVKAVV